MAKNLTEEERYIKKNTRLFFVNRFKWSHEGKRKRFRKLEKQGYVEKIERTRDGWLYKSHKIKKVEQGSGRKRQVGFAVKEKYWGEHLKSPEQNTGS